MRAHRAQLADWLFKIRPTFTWRPRLCVYYRGMGWSLRWLWFDLHHMKD